jgi:glycolate oxidase
MYDENSPGECRRAERVREDILSRVLALGGTVSGEHGIGQGKRKYLSRQLTPLQLELMRGVKKVFDPLNIMNPVLEY